MDLAAFRVHPNNYEEEGLGSTKDVPRRKMVHYGHHYRRYYQLQVEFVSSELGLRTLQRIEQMEWAHELADSSFFRQGEYLREEAKDEKDDI